MLGSRGATTHRPSSVLPILIGPSMSPDDAHDRHADRNRKRCPGDWPRQSVQAFRPDSFLIGQCQQFCRRGNIRQEGETNKRGCDGHTEIRIARGLGSDRDDDDSSGDNKFDYQQQDSSMMSMRR